MPDLEWPGVLRQGLTLLLGTLLVACQSPGVLPGSLQAGPEGRAPGIEQPTAVREQVTDTVLRGRVDLPDGRRTVQVAPDYAANGATLTLVGLADNMTVVTGRTNTDGSFVLSLNGFTPAPNSYYLLESSHGLNNHAAGNQVARFRTFLKWTGTSWTSTSGTSIVINPQTTAVAIISSLDGLNVPASSTMGKVSGSTINGSPTLTGHADSEIASLATAISTYLTNNLDPVENTPGLKPTISSLRPSNPSVGAAVMILGNGFSPVQTGDTVLFGTATASIFSASPTTLGVFVPNNAPSSGIVTVRTSMGVSTDNAAFTLTVSGGGSGGGGSGGGSSGLSIASLTPPNGAPGDNIMIRGTGFSTVLSENVVKFNAVDATVNYADSETLIVTVPAGASSGPLTVTVGGVSKGFYFNFTVPIIGSFNPNTGNQTTSVTVNGQNFATQGPQSKIRFNGFPSPNITSWFGTQAVGLAPAPSLTNRITGPVTIITDSGIVSQSGGTFTARQNVIEDLSTTNQKVNTTNAAWGSGALTPSAASTTFTQSGTQFGSNTNSGVFVSSLGLTLASNFLNHTSGVLPSSSTWYHQLGVDASSYWFGNGTTGYQFSLADGSQLTTFQKRGYAEHHVWDPVNNRYAYGTGHATGLYTYSTLTTTTIGLTAGTGIYYSAMGTNGTYYLAQNYSGGAMYWLGTGSGGTTFGTSYGTPLGSSTTSGLSIAGLTGSNVFYYTSGANGDTTSLNTLTAPGSVTGTIALPFTVSPLSNGHGPYIGSDGTYLYMFGRNASYNSNGNSLFRFTVSGSTVIPANYNINTNSTSATSAISRPANSIWDTVVINRTVPANTTLTVDVLDGSTNAVLMSNVANGQSLNGITASSIKLRATLNTTTGSAAPTLTSWSVTTRGSYAASLGYDTGTNFGQYEAPVITANNSGYVIQYSDSADNSAWSAWTNDITTLSRRYVRYQLNFTASNTQITRINLPYTY